MLQMYRARAIFPGTLINSVQSLYASLDSRVRCIARAGRVARVCFPNQTIEVDEWHQM